MNGKLLVTACAVCMTAMAAAGVKGFDRDFTTCTAGFAFEKTQGKTVAE